MVDADIRWRRDLTHVPAATVMMGGGLVWRHGRMGTRGQTKYDGDEGQDLFHNFQLEVTE